MFAEGSYTVINNLSIQNPKKKKKKGKNKRESGITMDEIDT